MRLVEEAPICCPLLLKLGKAKPVRDASARGDLEPDLPAGSCLKWGRTCIAGAVNPNARLLVHNGTGINLSRTA